MEEEDTSDEGILTNIMVNVVMYNYVPFTQHIAQSVHVFIKYILVMF